MSSFWVAFYDVKGLVWGFYRGGLIISDFWIRKNLIHEP